MNVLSLLLPLLALVILGVNYNQYRKHQSLKKAIMFFCLSGLVLCIAAAYRDGYGFSEDAVIPFVGTLSTILSILGGSLFLLAIIGVLYKHGSVQRSVFLMMNAIFVLKLVLVETMVWGIL